VPITRDDRRLLLFTGGLVVLAAVFVGVVLIVATGGGTPVERGPLYLGVASDLRQKIRDGGPLYFANPFAGPGFWLDLEGSQPVAIALVLPETKHCEVKWRATRNAYVDCNGDAIPRDDLARYETTVSDTGRAKGGVFVDLRKRLPPPGDTGT
jgi:hypothetical protein